jgi:ATP-dependent Clp protease ATP-binding subunit ClpA
VFEPFNDEATQAIAAAHEEARNLRHGYIGSEHVLLGILREGGIAAGVLASFDVTVEGMREQVARIVGSDEQEPRGQIPFTPRARKVLELARREAQSLGHTKIGTEHLLLGLLRDDEGVGIQVLHECGIDLKGVRAEIMQIVPARLRWAIEDALKTLIRAELYVRSYYDSPLLEREKAAHPVETDLTTAHRLLNEAIEALGPGPPPPRA